MIKAIQRNLAFFGGLAACGWLCAFAASSMISPRGAIGPTMLQAQSPMPAVVMVVGCVIASAVIAGLVGRVTNAAVGVFVLGAGVFVLAGRTVTISELAFGESSGSARVALGSLALETLLLAVVSLVAVMIVFAIAGPLKDIEPQAKGRRPHPMFSGEAMRSALAGLAVVPVVFLIAKSPMQGQLIGATFFGSMIAGLVGRLLSPHVQPVLLLVSPIVFGAIAHAAGMLLVKQPLDVAYVEQSLYAVSLPMPVDYAAGSLMGVAVGLGWARSFLHHEEQPGTVAA